MNTGSDIAVCICSISIVIICSEKVIWLVSSQAIRNMIYFDTCESTLTLRLKRQKFPPFLAVQSFELQVTGQ